MNMRTQISQRKKEIALLEKDFKSILCFVSNTTSIAQKHAVKESYVRILETCVRTCKNDQ